jgi:hypothetical protein
LPGRATFKSPITPSSTGTTADGGWQRSETADEAKAIVQTDAVRRPDAKLMRQHGGTTAGFYVQLPHKSFRVRDEVAARLLERNDVQPFDPGLPGFGGPQSWKLGNWREWTR